MAGGLFVTGLNATLPLPAWALTSPRNIHQGVTSYPAKSYFDLKFSYSPLMINDRKGRATAINGTVPAPLIRWREGDEVTMDVTNNMEDTEHASIHWHGVLVPFRMDGVPGVNFEVRRIAITSESSRLEPIGITAIQGFRSRPALTALSSSIRKTGSPSIMTAST